VPLEILRPAAETVSGSLEADWRRVRYREFEAAVQRHGAAAIATGHHKDDLVEGVLMQMLRGGGLRSMAGIHARKNKIIRPLLPFRRQQLLDWLGERAFLWVRDSSNADPAHLRNRVRHEALPCLESIAPRFRRQLVALSKQIAQIEDWMAAELGQVPFIDPWSPDGVETNTVASLPEFLRSRWLVELCRREGIGPCRRSQIEAMSNLLEGRLDSLNLPARWRLVRYRSRLYLEAPQARTYNFPLDPAGPQLPLRGWKVMLHPASRTDKVSVWSFGLENFEDLSLRSPHPGDRLADGRKLSRLLQTIHPLHLRWSWPILTRNDRILWIPGIAVKYHDSKAEWIVEVEKPCRI